MTTTELRPGAVAHLYAGAAAHEPVLWAIAPVIDEPHDGRSLRAFLLGPLYPLFFWLASALAAVRAEVPALFRGPAKRPVVWDIPRERAAG